VSQTPTTTRSVRGGRARAGEKAAKAPPTRRPRGSGGLVEARPGVWKIDIEIGRDPVTGKRRRASGTAYGTIEDAEVELAQLKVADHDGRRPRPGTRARSVGAVLASYVEEAETGVIELAPKTPDHPRRDQLVTVVLWRSTLGQVTAIGVPAVEQARESRRHRNARAELGEDCL
jgi:hypothetical protein